MTTKREFALGDWVYNGHDGQGKVITIMHSKKCLAPFHIAFDNGVKDCHCAEVLRRMQHDFHIGDKVVLRGQRGQIGKVLRVSDTLVTAEFNGEKCYGIQPTHLVKTSQTVKEREQPPIEGIEITYTAKFELDDGRIVEIPYPDDSWETESEHTFHRLARVELLNPCQFDFEIHKLDGVSYVSITHEQGKIWYKDIAQYIWGSRCLEITTWRKKPVIHEIPFPETYTNILKELR